MSSPTGLDCTLDELGRAFRKAKVDLFYSSRVCQRELLEFERDLVANLKRLQDEIRSGCVPTPAGSWTLAPKSLDLKPHEKTFFQSDPWAAWGNVPFRVDLS